MNEIKEWLDSPSDFEVGKKLYNTYAPRYKSNKILGAQINSFSNATSFNLLKSELKAILGLIPSSKSNTLKVSSMYHTAGKIKGLPEDLQVLDAQISPMYKQRDFLRYASRDQEPGDKLKEMAFEIIDLDLTIRKYYKVLDFYKRTGNYPPDWAEPEAYAKSENDKLIFWLNAMRCYPSWISRNKNNPNKVEELERKRNVMRDIDDFLKNANHQNTGTIC